MNWESLIKDRMRPALNIVAASERIELKRKNARRKKQLERYHTLKHDPEWLERRHESQHKRRDCDEYRAKHAKESREWRKHHVMTEHERQLHRERNRRYKERKKSRIVA